MKFKPGQTAWWLCPFPRQVCEVIIGKRQLLPKGWHAKPVDGGSTYVPYVLESELFTDKKEALRERDNTCFQPGQIVWWLSPFSQQVHPVIIVMWRTVSNFTFGGHWEVEGLSHGERIKALRSELFPCREGAKAKQRDWYPKPKRRYV